MDKLIVGAVQVACGDDLSANLDRIEALVADAAARGARLVVLQELIDGCYFCKDVNLDQRARARPLAGHPAVTRLSALAAKLGVVLPVSVYEADGDRRFNTLVMVDADGSILGHYRKSHIPNGPGYWEKSYFADGDTGFRVWDTRAGRIGAGVCWDQWFPEAARAMVLMGADLLIYPTAIGSEPADPCWDSRDHWQRAMQGHAAANLTPVIAGEPRRHRDRGDGGGSLLRLVLHRRLHRRQGGRGRPRQRMRHHGRTRHVGDAPQPPRLGRLPRPPARPLRHPDRADACGFAALVKIDRNAARCRHLSDFCCILPVSGSQSASGEAAPLEQGE